jgi:hypothetical protein
MKFLRGAARVRRTRLRPANSRITHVFHPVLEIAMLPSREPERNREGQTQPQWLATHAKFALLPGAMRIPRYNHFPLCRPSRLVDSFDQRRRISSYRKFIIAVRQGEVFDLYQDNRKLLRKLLGG